MIIESDKIQPMLDFSKEKYDAETFEHAKRVAEYTIHSPLFVYAVKYVFNDINVLYCIALAHDLIEDTDATMTEIIHRMPCPVNSTDVICAKHAENVISDSLYYLTRAGETYHQYCKRIREYGGMAAYCIKLADMKDHLTLKETLTDSLKERYISGLSALL